jgi:hypothetical protein
LFYKNKLLSNELHQYISETQYISDTLLLKWTVQLKGTGLGQFHSTSWYCLIKTSRFTGHQWLTLVILTTQEAEMRTIAIQSQTQANSL